MASSTLSISEQKQQANELRKSGKYDKALLIYENLWSETGDAFDGAGLLHCLRKLGIYDKAIPFADELIVKYPTFEWCKKEVYHQNLNSEIHKICSLQKIVDIRQVSEIMYFLELKVDTVFGMPLKIAPSGISADFDRDIHLVIPVDGDISRIKPYMILVGNLSSYLEHAVTEVIYQTEAISAVKAIQLAHDQGIPVHTITSQNINTELQLLQVSEQVKDDIRNAINAGREAIIPERNLTFHDWNGVGYIIQDPSKGSGAYLISGGLGGGAFVDASGFDNVILVPVSATASEANKATIKQMVCFPGIDNQPRNKVDICYTVIAFEDIDKEEIDSCGSTDPGCKKKYKYSHSFFAQPLIDIKEHGSEAYLTKYIKAEHWQSQDGARYMRAGEQILLMIESLMYGFQATEHNLSSGSGYRTQDRNEYLRQQGIGASKTSNHMDGVAADITLAKNGINIPKCWVLFAAFSFCSFGLSANCEVLSEDTKTKKYTFVHIAKPASPNFDIHNGFWGCE
ncbi:MAG: hypothetical protein AB1480_15980 [Nitrospirota bacterium]